VIPGAVRSRHRAHRASGGSGIPPSPFIEGKSRKPLARLADLEPYVGAFTIAPPAVAKKKATRGKGK